MFEKLRSAISSLTDSISKSSLSEKDLDSLLWRFELGLLESDVSENVAKDLATKVKGRLFESKLDQGSDAENMLKDHLMKEIKGVFDIAGSVDIQALVRFKKMTHEPFTIMFLGVNGTGKTTTLAKIAYLFKEQGFSVVLASGDTHRAGAIEQLSTHAERLNLKFVSQRYGADPAAVGRDAIAFARNHHVDVVLLDTAGRMQTSRNLMDEVTKIVRVVKPDLKIFVADSLTGNDAISQATEFLASTEFDAAILTKVDADAKGGAALSIAYIAKKPIIYFGVGQEYNDLIAFEASAFINSLFSPRHEVAG